MKRLLIGFALLYSIPAYAQFTWTGGGSDSRWSTGGNWAGGVPPASDGVEAVALSGSAGTSPQVDRIWQLQSLQFSDSAASFTLAGSLLWFSNDSYYGDAIINLSLAPQQVHNPLLFSEYRGIRNSGTLEMSGTITAERGLEFTGSGHTRVSGSLRVGGELYLGTTGTVTLSGSSQNRVGYTDLGQGTLVLAKTNGALALTGDIDIASYATLRLEGSHQIAKEAAVGVNSLGRFELNGYDQSIRALSGSGTVDLGDGLAPHFLTVDADDDSNFSGVLTGSGGLIKRGGGTLFLQGDNSYTGGTRIRGGTLEIVFASNLGDLTTEGLLLDGGRLQVTDPSFYGAALVTLTSATALTVGPNGGGLAATDSVDTLVVQSSVTNTDPASKLAVTGRGEVRFEAANPFTGSLQASGGTARLATQGSFLHAAEVLIAEGQLVLDNTDSVADRLNDTAPVLLQGGSLVLVGNSAANVSEVLGTLQLASGSSSVSLQNTSSTQTTNLSFASLLSRTPGAGATVSFGNQPGSDSGLGSGTFGPHLFFQTAPLIGADGFLGAWAYFNHNDFAGYDLTLGVTPLGGTRPTSLTSSAEPTVSTTGPPLNPTPTGTYNVILSSSEPPLTADAAANSLVLDGTANLDLGRHSLVLTSGGLIKRSDGINSSILNGTLTSGGPELIINTFDPTPDTPDTLVIDAGITGTLDLVKTGAGTLLLGGSSTSSNTYSGVTILNEGRLQLQKSGAVALPGDVVVNRGQLQSNFAEQIADDAAVTINPHGSISFQASETIGSLLLNGGYAVLNSGGNLSLASLQIQGAEFYLYGSLDLSGSLSAGTGHHHAIISGPGSINLPTTGIIEVADGGMLRVHTHVSAPGTFTKRGDGALVIESSDGADISGPTAVHGGKLILNNWNSDVGHAHPVLHGDISVAAGATLRTEGGGQLGHTARVDVLQGGTFELRGPEWIESLTGAGTVAFQGGSLEVESAIDRIFAGTLTGAGGDHDYYDEGDLNFVFSKSGPGRLTLTGTSDLLGGIGVDEGVLAVAGSLGALQQTAFVGLNQDALFVLDNLEANQPDRLNNSAAVLGGGGIFRLQGHASADSAEEVGLLMPIFGNSTVEAVAGAGQSAALTFDSITRLSDWFHDGSLYRPAGLATLTFGDAGGALGASGANPRIFFQAAPAGPGEIIGGWAYYGTSDFAAYNASLGVIPLGSSNRPGQVAGAGAFDHVLVAGTQSPLSAHQSVGSLLFSASQPVDLAGHTLQLTSGGLLVRPGVSAEISGGALVGPDWETLYLNVAGGLADQLVISASLGDGHSSFDLVKLGGGTLRLTGATANPFYGTVEIQGGTLVLAKAPGTASLHQDVIIQSGTLRLESDEQIGSRYASIYLAEKGLFDLNAHTESVGYIYGNGTIDIAGGKLVLEGGASSSAFEGRITGAGTLHNRGGWLDLDEENAFSGTLQLSHSTVRLQGALDSLSSLVLDSGGRLEISSYHTRFADSQINDAAPLLLRGGSVDYRGGDQPSSHERLGAVTISHGLSTILAQYGDSWTGSVATLELQSLGRNQADHGGVVFSPLVGSYPNTSEARILLSSPPSLNDGIIGGWAFATDYNQSAEVDFATYDSASGVRPLSSAGRPSTFGTDPTANIRTTGNVALSADSTINSLHLAGSHAVDLGTARLSIESGGLLKTGNSAGSLSGGFLSAPGELVIHSTGLDQILISSVLSDSLLGPLDVATLGEGTVSFTGSAANMYTGTTFVSGSSLVLERTAGVNAIPGNLVIGIPGERTGHHVVHLGQPNQIADTAAVTLYRTGALNLAGLSETIGSLHLLGGELQQASGLVISGLLEVGPGGVISPGESPGLITSGEGLLAGGGTFRFEIDNATGSAGANWDLWRVLGNLDISAHPGSPFSIEVVGLNAPLLNLDLLNGHSWLFLQVGGTITGFDSAAFKISLDSSLQQQISHDFLRVIQGGDGLYLQAIPEPETYALFAVGGLLLAWAERRRRKNR